MADDLEEMGTFAVKRGPTMKVWPHEETRPSGKGEESRLGWIFVASLALFIAVLIAVGGLLRFIW